MAQISRTLSALGQAKKWQQITHTPSRMLLVKRLCGAGETCMVHKSMSMEVA